MFNGNDEYINATKDARINMGENNSSSIKLWMMNLALLSIMVLGSYYTYLYFNKSDKHSTIVMGATHTSTLDNDLIEKLYNVEVDTIIVENDNESISYEMKKIIDASLVKNDSKYIESLALEVDNSVQEKKSITSYEKIISEELKLLN